MQRKSKAPAALSAREAEVCELILGGYSNGNIAARLELSEETVKRHVSTVLLKAGVLTRLDLAVTLLTRRHQAELATLQGKLCLRCRGLDPELFDLQSH